MNQNKCSNIARVVVVLIKPTHYADDGFPYRFFRGVLPSNSLAAMRTLTSEALHAVLPARVPREIHMLEDGIARHADTLERLALRFPEQGTKLIVGLVAVQTAQFPRACDLVSRWQAHGATCVIGGFHVSGSIATMLDGVRDHNRPDIPCPHQMPKEIQALLDHGVIVFHGEAEEVWRSALRDIIAGHPAPLYRGGQPDLSRAPLPEYEPGYFDRSFATAMDTFDTGRGCPFICSFCTIINVQGRMSRYRSPVAIIARVQEICLSRGKAQFFFTDDNFARNPLWEELLDGLIALRGEGCDVSFMVEADLACYKIPRFIEKLGRAGCSQIFMGVESMNPENLAEARKRQNNVAEYGRLWSACHAHGILVHAGYIIGFPHDTPETVNRDIEILKVLGADQASFFMLTPLPGSEDHARLSHAGVPMDPDLSKRDSFHVTVPHSRMTRQEWTRAYERAWRQFYTVAHMREALARCPARAERFYLLRNYLWYRWSFETERTHPMIAGFYRVRPYHDRRPGAPRLSRIRYLAEEVWRHVRYFGRFLAEFYRFQYLVFESERGPAMARVREEWGDRIQGAGDWFRLTFGRGASRRWLNAFWLSYARKRWQLLWNPLAYWWHFKMLPFAASEVVYTFRFLARLVRLVRATTT